MKSLSLVSSLSSARVTGPLVRCGAGATLGELCAFLGEHGLALANLGSITDQTVAGALATGTHGTGAGFGILATCIESFTLVDGTGKVWSGCSEDNHRDVFKAGLCGLGALGVMVEVVIRPVPAFNLDVVATPMPIEDALEGLDVRAKASEHFKLLYYPFAEGARVITSDTTEEPARPDPRSSFWRDSLLGHHLLEAAYALSRLAPSVLVPLVNKVFYWLLFSAPGRFIAPSREGFVIDCLFKQYVNEWAIPAERCAEALAKIREAIKTNGFTAHFPIEVRYVKADDIWLSPCYGRETAYIGVIMYRPYGLPVPYKRYWQAYEDIMRGCGGRPHWAKAHGLKAKDLAQIYPKWQDFLALRAKLDPNKIFMNGYLERVLM
jgi:L-gulonolactone oxidase